MGDWRKGKERIDKILSYDFLFNEYINCGKSGKQISYENKVSLKAVFNRLKKYGINIRNISASKKMPLAKEKQEKTLLEKYGVKNSFQCEATAKTLKEKYGVENIFQVEEIKNKSKKTMIEKYGVEKFSGWWGKTEKQKEKIVKKIFKNGFYRSSYELDLENILNKLNIEFKAQLFIGKNSYDFSIKKKKILIEVNGDFWHANPKLYKIGDILPYPGGSLKAEYIWERDVRKKEYAERRGYKIFYIWENDIKNGLNLEEFILEILNENNKNKIN